MLVRSCLAVALEYGYYNLKNGGFDNNKETAMFVDSGETHTTVYVVEYSKVSRFPSIAKLTCQNTITLKYLKNITGVSGRHYTQNLLETVVKEKEGDLKYFTKSRIRCLDTISKAKTELNISDVDETYVDLSDYLGDEYEEFDDEVEVEASDMNDGFEKIQKEWARQYGDVCKVGEDNDYEYDNNNYHFFLSLLHLLIDPSSAEHPH